MEMNKKYLELSSLFYLYLDEFKRVHGKKEVTDSFMGKDFYEKGFSHLDHKSKEILNEINKDLVEVESEYNSFMNNISNISKGESEKDLFEKKIKKIMNEKKFFENLRLF